MKKIHVLIQVFEEDDEVRTCDGIGKIVHDSRSTLTDGDVYDPDQHSITVNMTKELNVQSNPEIRHLDVGIPILNICPECQGKRIKEKHGQEGPCPMCEQLT